MMTFWGNIIFYGYSFDTFPPVNDNNSDFRFLSCSVWPLQLKIRCDIMLTSCILWYQGQNQILLHCRKYRYVRQSTRGVEGDSCQQDFDRETASPVESAVRLDSVKGTLRSWYFDTILCIIEVRYFWQHYHIAGSQNGRIVGYETKKGEVGVSVRHSLRVMRGERFLHWPVSMRVVPRSMFWLTKYVPSRSM